MLNRSDENDTSNGKQHIVIARKKAGTIIYFNRDQDLALIQDRVLNQIWFHAITNLSRSTPRPLSRRLYLPLFKYSLLSSYYGILDFIENKCNISENRVHIKLLTKY